MKKTNVTTENAKFIKRMILAEAVEKENLFKKAAEKEDEDEDDEAGEKGEPEGKEDDDEEEDEKKDESLTEAACKCKKPVGGWSTPDGKGDRCKACGDIIWHMSPGIPQRLNADSNTASKDTKKNESIKDADKVLATMTEDSSPLPMERDDALRTVATRMAKAHAAHNTPLFHPHLASSIAGVYLSHMGHDPLGFDEQDKFADMYNVMHTSMHRAMAQQEQPAEGPGMAAQHSMVFSPGPSNESLKEDDEKAIPGKKVVGHSHKNYKNTMSASKTGHEGTGGNYEVTDGKHTVLFSYATPVAHINHETNTMTSSSKKWSKSTNRHISEFAKKHQYPPHTQKEQGHFDKMAKARKRVSHGQHEVVVDNKNTVLFHRGNAVAHISGDEADGKITVHIHKGAKSHQLSDIHKWWTEKSGTSVQKGRFVQDKDDDHFHKVVTKNFPKD